MKNKLKIFIPVIVLIGLLLYIGFLFIEPPPEKVITIATDSEDGEYYEIALEYRRLLEPENVHLNIVNTSGSIENIKLLQEKKVDIAFIQNGTIKEELENDFESLAAIYNEPLWVFYHKELGDIAYIKDFKSKKIAIGVKGSGTEDLTHDVLRVNGIDSLNTTLLNYGVQKSVAALINYEVDALFMVISADSKAVLELMHHEDIALFPFRRADAYSKNFMHLEILDLHEGIINIEQNVPPNDVKLLTTTATLIARKHFSKDLIRLLLKKAKKAHKHKSLFTDHAEFPNMDHLNVPINEEAERYLRDGDTFLEKIFPFWIAAHLDRLKILLIPLLTLLIPISKSLFPLYRLRIRSKIYKWYKEVQVLDLSLDGVEKEKLEERVEQLEKLREEIKAVTKVPAGYMAEYYNLIVHLELIISKTNRKIADMTSV